MKFYFSGIGGTAVKILASSPLIFAVYLPGSGDLDHLSVQCTLHEMATKTITIKESAYRALVKWKEKDESFSDVIEREFTQKIETASDLLALAKRYQSEGRRFGFTPKRRRVQAA